MKREERIEKIESLLENNKHLRKLIKPILDENKMYRTDNRKLRNKIKRMRKA